jgi:hypothetical protein
MPEVSHAVVNNALELAVGILIICELKVTNLTALLFNKLVNKLYIHFWDTLYIVKLISSAEFNKSYYMGIRLYLRRQHFWDGRE